MTGDFDNAQKKRAGLTDGDPLCMDGAQVGVFKEMHHKVFCCLRCSRFKHRRLRVHHRTRHALPSTVVTMCSLLHKIASGCMSA